MTDWVSPASALIGVALGSSVTFLIESQKANREDRKAARADRQAAYLAFLESSSLCQQKMVDTAFTSAGLITDRALQLRAVFQDSGLYLTRERIRIFAADEVVQAVETSFEALRTYRDQLIEGTDFNSSEHRDLREAVSKANFGLRTAIRRDLQVGDTRAIAILRRNAMERTDNQSRGR